MENGTRVIASRFTLIDNVSHETKESGMIVRPLGLGYLIRFDRDGIEMGAFPSEITEA